MGEIFSIHSPQPCGTSTLHPCLEFGKNMEAQDVVEKLSRLIFRWVKLAWVWGRKSVKIRIHKFRLRKAQRNLDRRMSRLGAEFYSLNKQGETEFLKSLVVLQQLKIVQEAESQVFAIHDSIETVEKEYQSRKKAIMAESTGH
jgi:hypothetical protein